MKSKLFAVALAAVAALCLSACAGGPSPGVTIALNVASDVGPALQTVLQQDISAGKINASTGNAMLAAVNAGETALTAYQAATASCVGATTASCLNAALGQVNTALAQLAANPDFAKLLAGTTGQKVSEAIQALQQAVLAAEDVAGAANASSPAQAQAQALAAVIQFNGALFDVLPLIVP